MNCNTNEDIQKEFVYIETNDYIIRGYVSLPANQAYSRLSKNSRIMSNLLNSSRDFIAIENCQLKSRRLGSKKTIEEIEFLELNKLSILIMKPLSEN